MSIFESVIIKDSGGTETDVTAANALKVDGSAVTQPVSTASLPLPTGASTLAEQQTQTTALQNIDTDATTIISHVDGIEGVLTTIDADTGGILTAVQIMDDWDNGASDGASVSGDVAHDSADAGEPVKIGGKATDTDTSSAGEKGQTAVSAANDRVSTAHNLQGEPIIFKKAKYVVPTNVSTTYDDNPTSATSDAFDIQGYSRFLLTFTVANANTPTDIQFHVEINPGDGNFFRLKNDFLGSLIHSDASTNTTVNECVEFTATGDEMRIVVVATGTTSSNTFTVSNLNVRCMVA